MEKYKKIIDRIDHRSLVYPIITLLIILLSIGFLAYWRINVFIEEIKMGGSVNLNEVIDKSRADATQLFFIYALLVVATGIFLNLIIYLAKRDGFREGLKKALDHSSSSKVS